MVAQRLFGKLPFRFLETQLMFQFFLHLFMAKFNPQVISRLSRRMSFWKRFVSYNLRITLLQVLFADSYETTL